MEEKFCSSKILPFDTENQELSYGRESKILASLNDVPTVTRTQIASPSQNSVGYLNV